MIPLPQNIQHFTCSTVEEARPVAGFYAWYSVLNLGSKDWELDLSDGEDKGIGRLRLALARHSARFAVPPLHVAATGRFTASWRGRLDSDGSRQMSLDVAGEEEDGEGVSALTKVLNAPKLRAALVRALTAATPLFAAPLYIGVTDSLRRRLKEHVADLQKAAAVVAREPKARERLLEDGKQFAFRAVGSGFALDQLHVWTLDLAGVVDLSLGEADARSVAGAAEWLLNRWYRPLHGKR